MFIYLFRSRHKSNKMSCTASERANAKRCSMRPSSLLIQPSECIMIRKNQLRKKPQRTTLIHVQVVQKGCKLIIILCKGIYNICKKAPVHIRFMQEVYFLCCLLHMSRKLLPFRCEIAVTLTRECYFQNECQHLVEFEKGYYFDCKIVNCSMCQGHNHVLFA